MQHAGRNSYNGAMASPGHPATPRTAQMPVGKEHAMKKILALATFAALCAAQPAFAAGTGFYVGADLGWMSSDIDKGDLDRSIADGLATEGLFFDGTSDLDDSDTTWGLTVGYKFMPYLAVEGQYLDLGAAEYKASGDFFDSLDNLLGSGSLSAKVDSSGFALSVLGILPIQEVWEVYARLGMYFGDTEATMGFSDGVDSVSMSDSKNEEEFMYGIGGGYTFNETWNVRAEYTIIQNVGDDQLSGEADVSRFVIGLNYKF
jgi:OOP family OmpA-OmpF porin